MAKHEDSVATPDHPVDRGWAWMVTAGASLNLLCMGGAYRSSGIIFVEMLKAFEASSSLTAVMIGVQLLVYSVMAPFVAILGRRYGYRVITMAAGGCYGLGHGLLALSSNIYLSIAIYGCLTGVAMQITLSSSCLVLGQYFRDRHALASGIAFAGGSMGQLLFPQILDVLTREYDWRGVFIIFGGVMLHVTLGGALFRPISSFPRRKKRQPQHDKGDVISNREIIDSNHARLQNGHVPAIETSPVTNQKVKTGSEIYNGVAGYCNEAFVSTENCETNSPCEPSGQITHILHDSSVTNSQAAEFGRTLQDENSDNRSASCCKVIDLSGEQGHNERVTLRNRQNGQRQVIQGKLNTAITESGVRQPDERNINLNCLHLPGYECETTSNSYETDDTNPGTKGTDQISSNDTKMENKTSPDQKEPSDADMPAGMETPKVESSPTGQIVQSRSCVKLPVCFDDDSKEELSVVQSAKCESGSGQSQKLFDFSVLRDPVFMIYLLPACLLSVGFSTIFVFIPPHAEKIGVPATQASLALTISGGADLVCRLVIGWLGMREFIKRGHLLALCAIGSAVVILIAGSLMLNFAGLLIITCAASLAGSAYMVLNPVVMSDFVGRHRLPYAFTCSQFSFCLINAWLPSVYGLIADKTGNYVIPIIICGIFVCIGGVGALVAPLGNKCRKGRPQVESLETKVEMTRL